MFPLDQFPWGIHKYLQLLHRQHIHNIRLLSLASKGHQELPRQINLIRPQQQDNITSRVQATISILNKTKEIE